MVDRAGIFQSILERNALRREVGLSERPVRATYEHDVRRKLFTEYARENSRRITDEVLQMQRARFGQAYPSSWGGHQAVSALVHKRLRETFDQAHSGQPQEQRSTP